MSIYQQSYLDEFKKIIYSRDRIPVVEPMVEPLQVELDRMALEEMLKTNVTTAFEVPKDYLYEQQSKKSWLTQAAENDHQADVFRYAISQIKKEEDNMTEEMWSLYQVLAVEKSEVGYLVEPTIDMKVIAKNKEHAAGLSGYNDLIKKYDYDNTKVKVNIQWLMDIKPVEDDE